MRISPATNPASTQKPRRTASPTLRSDEGTNERNARAAPREDLVVRMDIARAA